MNEMIKLSDFDIVGIIKLKDVKGIEKYVTPIFKEDNNEEPTEFLSRSKEYYNVKSLTELSKEREELKNLLTRERTKRNFVILENMANASAKVYYKKLENYITNPNSINNYYAEISKACLLEDTRNLLTMLEGKGLVKIDRSLILPSGYENCAKRSIEMDNKALLYIFSKNLKIEGNPQDIQIATPGYGSIFIGPFLKEMYGYDFTNILKSKYINEISEKAHQADITQCVSNDKIFDKTKKVVLIDDNIGTGTTMREMKEQLKNKGIECYKSGAVQYNWRNYYRITVGDKTGVDRFNVDEYDIITPFNYAGHNLYSHAIDILHESGNNYIEYLNSKSYRVDVCNDLIGAIERGRLASEQAGLIISDTKTGKIDDRVKSEYVSLPAKQKEWIDSVIRYTYDLSRQENEKEKEYYKS